MNWYLLLVEKCRDYDVEFYQNETVYGFYSIPNPNTVNLLAKTFFVFIYFSTLVTVLLFLSSNFFFHTHFMAEDCNQSNIRQMY